MQSLEELQELNTRLHRRLQSLEGEWQSKVAKLEDQLAWLKDGRWHYFDRMCNAHKELKRIYEEAAKVTCAPRGCYHSVMDGCRSWGGNPEYVYASIFIPFRGVTTIRVLDEVKKALSGKKRWWKIW